MIHIMQKNAFIYSEDILTLCSTGDHLEFILTFLMILIMDLSQKINPISIWLNVI